MIDDNIRMFTGDHPAAQFEQGTKLGGNKGCVWKAGWSHQTIRGTKSGRTLTRIEF